MLSQVSPIAGKASRRLSRLLPAYGIRTKAGAYRAMAATHIIRLLVGAFAILAPAVGTGQPAPHLYQDVAPAQPVVARNGMVASQDTRATRIGVEVL